MQGSFHGTDSLDFHKMRKKKKTVLHDPGVMDWIFYCLGQGRKTRKTHEDIAHVETFRTQQQQAE